MKKLVWLAKAWVLVPALVVVAAAVMLLARRLPRLAERSPGAEDATASALAVAIPDTGTPAASPQDHASAIQLHEVTEQTGIAFQHTDGSSGRRYVVETMSAGLATFDYDGDGLIDIYFPNGAPLPGCKPDRPPRHALYRNLGGWRFEDVTEEAGVACTAFGLGICIGDYDNDGQPDIYLSNFGPNVLYHNNGDGTFTDVTRQAGVARDDGGPGGDVVGAGVCFLDVEGDGDLDLYVGNYIRLDCSAHVLHQDRGFPSYPSPREYDPVPDTLYRNNGDGTFTDISRPSGIAAHAGRSMGMTCADYDNDGDVDVFICNDVQENFLFRSNGKGKFEEVATIMGTATNRQGELMANMAVDSADYDHDGLLDFYTTNYHGQMPMLLRNFGDGVFDDLVPTTNAGAGCLPYVNWGCGMIDLDNDGYRDLFIANGHTEDNIERRDRSTCYRCPNMVLWNTGKGKFVDVSATAGDGLLPVKASRGTAFDDLDNDGDLDVVILNSRDRPTILRNMLQESGCQNHWLQVRLRAAKANRDGVGSHVTVTAGDLRQLDEVHSGRGYQSHWGSRLHFGLGRHDRVDRIEVCWMGGTKEVFENVEVDQLVTLTEGTGRAETGDDGRSRGP